MSQWVCPSHREERKLRHMWSKIPQSTIWGSQTSDGSCFLFEITWERMAVSLEQNQITRICIELDKKAFKTHLLTYKCCPAAGTTLMEVSDFLSMYASRVLEHLTVCITSTTALVPLGMFHEKKCLQTPHAPGQHTALSVYKQQARHGKLNHSET